MAFTKHTFHKKAILFLLLTVFKLSVFGQDTCQYLVWSDEFNYRGAPDPQKWGYDIGGNGWGNQELQTYTSSGINSFVQDGKLTIKAVKSNGLWTSARLVTKEKGDWLYGRIEVKAKLPEGKGTWPAIWMLPTDWAYGDWPKSGEIDIMEHVGYDSGIIHGTIHTEAYNHSIGTQLGKSVKVENVSTEFHVYTIDWNEDEIIWYVDGVEYYRIENPEKTYKEWPFDKRFHLILNIAIGGTWGGAQGIDPNLTKATMEIDYVKVFQKNLPEPVIDGKKNAAPNQELIFSTTEIQGIRYKWSFPEDVEVTQGGQTAQVTVKWGNTSGNVQLELQSDCDTVAAEPFWVNTVLKPSGESFEVPFFDNQNQMLWQPVPGNSNQINLTGIASLNIGYNISEPGENPHIFFDFLNPVDLSAFREMEILLKTPAPVPGSLRIDLIDANGNVNPNDQFKISSFEDDGNFHTYTYSFGQNPDGIFSLDLIKQIKVYINYGEFGKKGSGQVEFGSIKFKNTATFVGEIQSSNDLKVWPNPFQDNIFISSSKSLTGIAVFNMAGKILLLKTIHHLHQAEIHFHENPSTSILKATFEDCTTKNVVLVKSRL